MTSQKIKHPFQVPDDFFESFAPEMMDKISKEPVDKKSRSLIFTLMKYAAIVVISFLLGRVSMTSNKQSGSSAEKEDMYSVEAVYSQVSDDDIDAFIIENATSDLLE